VGSTGEICKDNMAVTQNNKVLTDLNLVWTSYLSLIKKALPTEARIRLYPACVYEDLLLRFYLGIKSCQLQLTYFEEELRFPIAIQLRSLVLDSMIAVYLAEFRNDEEKFNEEIAKLDHQSAGVLNKTLEKNNQNGKFDKQKSTNFLKTSQEIYPKNFTINNKTKFNNQYDNNNLTASKIKNTYSRCVNNSDTEKEWMEKCYEQYCIFSFYEHYNSMFPRLLHNNIDYDLNKFSYVSKFIIDASLVAMYINGTTENIISKTDLLNKQVVNIGTNEFNIN
jgi:hypothetical protein